MSNNYKRHLSKEELSLIQNERNNFLTEFPKHNMSEVAKGIVINSYNQINPTHSDKDDMYSMVNTFTEDMVDDAIASKVLTFGAKINPTNYMESLSNLLHKYGKKESEERMEIFRMKYENGSIPSLKENKVGFMKELKKVFSNLSLSGNIKQDFDFDYKQMSFEEEDIVDAIRDQVVTEIEKTEDNQKKIHDIMQEVEDIKEEYAEKVKPDDEDSDTKSELNTDSSTDSDVDNSGSDHPELQNNESYRYSLEGKSSSNKSKKKKLEEKEEKEKNKTKDDKENKKKGKEDKPFHEQYYKKATEGDESEEEESDTGEEGLGVTGTYQNEDVFGGMNSSESARFYESEFDSLGYPTISKELASIEDAIKAIVKDAAYETYGSEGGIKSIRNKLSNYSRETLDLALENLYYNEKFKNKNIRDNIFRYKDYLASKAVVNSVEDFTTSGRRFKLTIPSSEDILNSIISSTKSLPVWKTDKEKYISKKYNNLVLEKLKDFFTGGAIKNFAFATESDYSGINLYQLWRLRSGVKVNSYNSTEEFYNLIYGDDDDYNSFGSEDLATDSLNEIKNELPKSSTPFSTPLLDSAMSEVKTVIKENPDNGKADEKIIDPQRGSELDKSIDPEESEERFKFDVNTYDSQIKEEIKKAGTEIGEDVQIFLREAFKVSVQGEINKMNDAIQKIAKRIGNYDIPRFSSDELADEFIKYCEFTNPSEVNGFIDQYREMFGSSGVNKGRYKNQMIVCTFPSPQKFIELVASKANLKVSVVQRLFTALLEGFILAFINLGFAFFTGGAGNILYLGWYIYQIISKAQKSVYRQVLTRLKGKYSKYFFFYGQVTANLNTRVLYYGQLASVIHEYNSIGMKLDYELKSSEGFENIFNDDNLFHNTLPKSLVRFENTPILSSEQLSLIFLRKGEKKFLDLEKRFNKSIEHLEIKSRRDNRKDLLSKLATWKSNLKEGIRLFRNKSTSIGRLGLRPDHIKEEYKYNLGTQAVVKNLLNYNYLPGQGKYRIPRICSSESQYTHSIERLVDLTFAFELRKRKADKIYPSAIMAREDLEVREDELDKALIEATPEDKNFVKNLKDSLVFKDLGKFFTFDMIMNDFTSIFYKYQDTVDIKGLVSGDGFKSQVLKGLESKRGELDEQTIKMVDRYLEGKSIENINPTRLERFGSKILRMEKAKWEEALTAGNEIPNGGVFNKDISKMIRDKSILSLTLDTTRRALGFETLEVKNETERYLKS